MMELLQIDSLALAKIGEGPIHGVSTIWMWVAIIEGCIILGSFIWSSYKKDNPMSNKIESSSRGYGFK